MPSTNRVGETLDFDDPINIQYTSGTIGLPKAVVLSHHNILNNAWFSARAMHFTSRDRLCVPEPFYHCFRHGARQPAVPVRRGLRGHRLQALRCPRSAEAVETERCTALHGLLTMFIVELEHPRFREFDLSSLRTRIMAGALSAGADKVRHGRHALPRNPD